MGILILLIVCLAFSAFFSAVEIAFFSLSAHRIHAMRKRGLSGADLVEELKKRPHRLMATILVGNNLVNISIASLASAIAVSKFGSVGVGIATAVTTIIVLLFGEILPKAFATTRAGTFARVSARIVLVIEFILYPVVIVLEILVDWLTKSSAGKDMSSFTVEEDIRSLMQMGYEKGKLEDYERSFVEKLFLFDDKPVSKAMMPITDVFMFRSDQLIGEIEHVAVNSGYSRFPVYKWTRANICGVVHIKDIVTANNRGIGDQPVSHIMTVPMKFRAQTIINDVFLKMRKMKVQYAIVTKESKPVGIVTLEDIIEELIGEIHDEYDSHKGQVL